LHVVKRYDTRRTLVLASLFYHVRTPLRFDNEHRVAPTPSPGRFGGLCSHREHAATISRKDALRRTDTLSPAQSVLTQSNDYTSGMIAAEWLSVRFI